MAILIAVSLPVVLWGASAWGQDSPAEDLAAVEKESGAAPAEAQISMRVPLFSPSFADFPVAEVNGEPITLKKYTSMMASFHTTKTTVQEAAKIDYGQVLERLINVKLVEQEAERIGLNDLPEVKDQVDAFSRATRRQLLMMSYLRESNPRLDEDEIAKIYNENVKEHKIRSVLFEKEEDAKKMEEEIRAGKSFEELADRLIDEGAAKGSKEAAYVKLGTARLQPPVVKAAAGMAAGSVSPVIRVNDGFVLLKVVDIRYPEDPEERRKAEKTAASRARGKALEEYKQVLIRKYAKADKKLIGSIDFEAKKPGFERLLKDKRPVVRIQGEKPVTVGEWARAIQEKFYHGVTLEERARKINRKKLEILDELVTKRILEKEALSKGIDKTDEYKSKVEEFRDSLVFGTFLGKVVGPDVKVSPEEIRDYYNAHAGDFLYPEMVRIDGLAFGTLRDAEDALAKLQKGSDIKWLKDNAEGRVPATAPDLMEFNGDLVTTTSLPKEVGNAVTGARPGDLRIHASPEGYVYVLQVREVVPPRARPPEEAERTVASAVYNEKFNRSVEEWFEKLRKAGDVKVYLTQQ